MNNKSNNNDLAVVSKLTTPVPDVLNLNIRDNLQQSMEILTNMIKNKTLGKINTPEGALGYYVKTKELGLPFVSSVDHFVEVSGKTSLDVHLMRAMVLRAGVIHWEIIYNNSPLYKYIDSTGAIIATSVDDSCLPDIYEEPKGNNSEELAKDVNRIKSIAKTPVFKTIDKIRIDEGSVIFNYATKYKFTRYFKFPNGVEKELIEFGEFSIKEAVTAGLHLFKDGSVNYNSPWLSYHRNMLEHRAWTFGARKIADDILFGLLETTELYDINKIDYTIEEGRAKVVQEDNS